MTGMKQTEGNDQDHLAAPEPKDEAETVAARLGKLQQEDQAVRIQLLLDEDSRRFTDRLETWLRELAPANEAEVLLVRQAALLAWRLERADRHETAILSQKMLDALRSCETEEPAAICRTAALAAFDSSIQGERLRRYQFTLQRELRKTLESLAKLKQSAAKQMKPTSQAVVPIEPISTSPNPAGASTSTIAPNSMKSAPVMSMPPTGLVSIRSERPTPRPTDSPMGPRSRPTQGSLRENSRRSIPAGWDRRRKPAMELLNGKPCVLAETSLLTPRGSEKANSPC